MVTGQLTFPQVAQDRIRAFQSQIVALEEQLQQFADGILIGMGVDVLNSDISVDLGTMIATVTPKQDDGRNDDSPSPSV